MPVPMPVARPARPFFSSGPCAKRPGWSLSALEGALLGRSHRSEPGRAALGEVIARSKAMLGMPREWRVAIVPGSDTGAIELALWSLIGGRRGVDVLAFESFSRAWAVDVVEELAPPGGVRVLQADYGRIPELAAVDWSRDVVFAWNGTTSGVRIPDADWIAPDRTGLSICDATSAAFAMALPWDRLDVVTWSWQKVLGGEAAHGMLALSPAACERLVAEPAARGLPKLFRLVSDGRLIEGVFTGDTINTPSMLCVEDALDGLRWAERIGGLPALIARSRRNLAVVEGWIERSGWASFLAREPSTRSSTSICIEIGGTFRHHGQTERRRLAGAVARRLEALDVGFDLNAYRDAPAGFRIWGGATVEASDIEALLPWLDWAIDEAERAG